MPTKDETFRMDFVIEVEDFDEANGKFAVKLIPNPERYELKEMGGEKGYYDKFDNTFISLKVLEKATTRMEGLPIYYSPPKVVDTLEYIGKRTPIIREHFEKEGEKYQFVDSSEEFLSSLETPEKDFVILSIDLVGSTAMSQTLEDADYSKLISLFSKEVTLLVHLFRGYVLKNIGDGLVAYFPGPNFVGMNDNALDCAASMRSLILRGINPVLKERDLPEFNFRIGLDSGDASIITIGADQIKQHKDLIGQTLNIACKIQSKAEKNQILIGESTAKNVHTFWRELLEKKEIPDWKYVDKKTGNVYPLYLLKEPKQEKLNPLKG